MADTDNDRLSKDGRDVETVLEEALGEIHARQPQPPPGFTASIMRRVQAIQGNLSAWRRWHRARRATNFSYTAGVVSSQSQYGRPAAVSGGAIVSKKILWGVVGLGAAAAVSMFFLGIPPVGDGTAGTIGAAKRYQGAAMSDKDVKTGPMAVQAFIQSETFDRILKKPALRNIMIKVAKDPKLQKAFSDPAFIEMFTNVAFLEMFNDAAFQEAFTDAAFQEMFTDPAFQEMFDNPAFQEMFDNPAFKEMFENAAFIEALNEPSFKEMMNEPAFMEAMENPAFAQAMKEPKFVEMLGEPAFVEALGEPAFLDAMAEPAFIDAMAEPAFMEALGEPAFIEMLGEPAFQEAFKGRYLGAMLADPSFQDALIGGGRLIGGGGGK